MKKVRSIVLGLRARVALSVLALCGATLTGCYEKEEIDAPQAPAEAVYYVVGSVTDGATGQPVAVSSSNVTISPAATAGAFTNEAFKFTVSGPGVYQVSVRQAGYYDVTRTVNVLAVPAGQTNAVIADIALFDATSAPTTPPVSTPAPPAAAELEKPATVTAITETITGSFLPTTSQGDPELPAGTSLAPGQEQTVSINAQTGEVTVTTPLELAAPQANPVPVSVPVKSGGFELVGDVTADSRAVNPRDQFIANVAAALGMKHGATATVYTTTVGQTGMTLTGYTVEQIFELQEFAFEIEGTVYRSIVTWAAGIRIIPVYGADSHDGHDGHGGGNGAGGGAGQ
jgi:hypothetical protein